MRNLLLLLFTITIFFSCGGGSGGDDKVKEILKKKENNVNKDETITKKPKKLTRIEKELKSCVDGETCYKLSAFYYFREDYAKYAKEYYSLLEKSCDLKWWEGCLSLASLYDEYVDNNVSLGYDYEKFKYFIDKSWDVAPKKGRETINSLYSKYTR